MTTTTVYGSFFNATGALNPATVVADFLSNGDTGWREQMEACGAIDAIIAEYTAAINKVLPEGISLVDDQFIGPHYTDDAWNDLDIDETWDDLDLDEAGKVFSKLNELIEGVDLSEIVQGHSDAAEQAALNAIAAAVATREATEHKLAEDRRAVADAIRAARKLEVPAARIGDHMGITRARVYQILDEYPAYPES